MYLLGWLGMDNAHTFRCRISDLCVVVGLALWYLCSRSAWLWFAQKDPRVIAYDHHFVYVESQAGTIAVSINDCVCGEARQPPPLVTEYDRKWRQLRRSDGLERVFQHWQSSSGDERLSMRIRKEQASAQRESR